MSTSTGEAGGFPIPPVEYMRSVGSGQPTAEATLEDYLDVGRASRLCLERHLGPDWDWRGKRLLDFGCGAGRLLRQIPDWAEAGEVFGSDVDRPMAEWAREHLCPPIADVEVNGFEPPLEFPDDHFDVVSAFSVFTHLGTNWADWLLEVRRVLKPDGLLVATILDRRCAEAITSVPYDEDSVGMSVFAYTVPEMPYINVLHSHWWIREHWGRAFEIISIDSGQEWSGFVEGGEFPQQGVVVARPRSGSFSPEDLRRNKPGEERYLDAWIHQQELFRADADRLKARFQESETKLALLEHAHREALDRLRRRSLKSRIKGLLGRSRPS